MTGQDEKGERRQDRRYDLKLELSWKTIQQRWKTIQQRQLTESGVGHTLDLSSGGVRFTAGSDLLMGSNVELSFVWPALLDNVLPMKLAIQGEVVRSAKGWAAVRILRHELECHARVNLAGDLAAAPDGLDDEIQFGGHVLCHI